MELYSLQLQKVVADFTDFDAITKQYVDQKVSQAKQELTNGASSALDTFRELEDYLTASGVAGGLVEQIAALSASITAEASRAGTEEGKLDARVTTLENSSVSANLQSELDATQQGAGLDLDGSYVAESARNYISDATSLKSADALLDTALKAEVDRAEAAEAKIASDLAAEQSTRFSQNVAATNDRAAIRSEFGSADTTLQTQIDELSGSNSVLSTDLQSEITRAKAREDQIELDLFTESSRATNKEGDLQVAIDNEALRATNVENDIKTGLDSEVSRAEDAEGVLQTNIDTEKSRAEGAEFVLQTNIGNLEADTRQERTGIKYATLGLNNIADYADGVNIYRYMPDDDAAYFTPEGDNSDLSMANHVNQIDREVQINKGVIGDVNPSGNKLFFGSGSEQPKYLRSDPEAKVTIAETAVDALKNVAQNLDTQVVAATSDREDIKGDLSAEVSRAEDAEGELQTNIDTEKARAEDAEGVLQGNVDAERGRAEGVEANLATGIELLGARPHDGVNGGFDIGHQEGNPDNKYMYFSQKWRLYGSAAGDRLIFEYNKGTPEVPDWKSAVPFISHV